mgnify:CR=1 FL=1
MTPASAMIFAAGFGTRMGPLTQDRPKPMIPLAGRPMIDHAIDLVRDAGIQHIVANTHYLHDRIAPHLETLGLTVCHETPDILDTGGGLRAALPHLGDGPVVTLNPDAAWTGPNPVAQLLSHWRDEMQALLMLVPLDQARSSRQTGDFSLCSGEIQRSGPYLYAGAQIIRTDRLHEIDLTSFSLNLYWDRLLAAGPVHAIDHPGQWCDIGHPDGLREAEQIMANHV